MDKKSQNASEEKQGRGNFLPDIKIYEPIIIKIVWYWYRDRWMEQNRDSKNRSMHIWNWFMSDSVGDQMKY